MRYAIEHDRWRRQYLPSFLRPFPLQRPHLASSPARCYNESLTNCQSQSVVDAAARCPQVIVTCIFSCRFDTSHRDAHNKCIFGLIGRPLSSAAKHVTNPRPLRVLSHLRKNLAQL